MLNARLRAALFLTAGAATWIGGGGVARAEVIGPQWSVSPLLGVHEPSLGQLNKGEFRSPYKGKADIISESGANVSEPFEYRNPVPPFGPQPAAGVEFQWLVNEKNAFLIGVGTWQGVTEASFTGRFPVQGAFQDVISSRKIRLSYTDYYLGWRYNAFRKPKKYNIYFRFAAHEIFDIDHREDFSLYFLSGPPKGFRKTNITLAQATGLVLFDTGIGGEYFVRNWLSFGFDASVSAALHEIHLRDGKLYSDFLSSDNLNIEMPMKPNVLGNMEYRLEDGSDYKQLNLNFNGWSAFFRVNFYY